MSDGPAKACGLGKMYSVKENISHFIENQTEWETYMLIFNFLTHLIAMNGHSAGTAERELPNAEAIPEPSPDFPVPTELRESSELSEPTSESQKSTRSSPDDTDTDTDSKSSNDTQSTTSQSSTASNRTLGPRLPINYKKTWLQCGRPQIRTFNNDPYHSQIPAMRIHKKQMNTHEKTQVNKYKRTYRKTQAWTSQANELFQHCNCKTYI